MFLTGAGAKNSKAGDEEMIEMNRGHIDKSGKSITSLPLRFPAWNQTQYFAPTHFSKGIILSYFVVTKRHKLPFTEYIYIILYVGRLIAW